MSRAAPQRTDEALLEAVARADEDALGELYDRFGKVAYGLACRSSRTQRLPRTPSRRRSSSLARRRLVPARAREGEHVAAHVRAPPRRRPRPPRGAPAHVARRSATPRAVGPGRRREPSSRARAARSSRTRCAASPPSSARRSSSPTTAASRSRSSPNGSASRSARSRAACSPGLQRLRVLLAEAGYESA